MRPDFGFDFKARVFPLVNKHRQQGALLLTSIVILVLFALLSAAMASLIRVSDTSTAQEVLSVRALLSAQSGANRFLACMASSAAPNRCTACGASVTYLWVNAGGAANNGLASCSASVTCQQLCDPGSGCTLMPGMGNYVDLSVDGNCGSGDTVARRSVEVRYNIQ